VVYWRVVDKGVIMVVIKLASLLGECNQLPRGGRLEEAVQSMGDWPR